MSPIRTDVLDTSPHCWCFSISILDCGGFLNFENSQYVMDGPSEIRPGRSVNRREMRLKVGLTNVDLYVDLGAIYVELLSLCQFSQYIHQDSKKHL